MDRTFWATHRDNIEIISYDDKYEAESMDVFCKSFLMNEMVCIGSEVNKCPQAQQDLQILCKDAAKDGVSLLARDKKTGALVGVLFNKIQFPVETEPDAQSYFEWIRDCKCISSSSKSLMNYMIEMDSRIDLFERFKIDCLFEVMFLGVLPEYEKLGIATKLCEVAIQIATGLKNEKYIDLLKPHVATKRPQLVSALFTSKFSQRVGNKLNFQTVYEEPFDKFIFNGVPFSARIGPSHPTSTLAIKII